jgi:hypothetical protein
MGIKDGWCIRLTAVQPSANLEASAYYRNSFNVIYIYIHLFEMAPLPLPLQRMSSYWRCKYSSQAVMNN